MPYEERTCTVCTHPDRRAMDILLFQGYDEHTVLNILRDIEDLPKARDLKSHCRLGHQAMDQQACVSVLTGVIRHCHKIQTDAENARQKGHLWEYRSRSTTAMKTEMKAIELIARLSHLITDNRTPDSNVIEEVFKADENLLDRIIQNRLEQRGQKIVNIAPAPSALARVTGPIEDAETVAPEANANGAHG